MAWEIVKPSRKSRLYRVFSLDDNTAQLHLRGGLVVYYWRPVLGGYVHDVTRSPGTSGQQVCRGLSGYGSALYQTGGRLADLIRAEARSAAGRRTLEALAAAHDLKEAK